jgi:hypothetical protein
VIHTKNNFSPSEDALADGLSEAEVVARAGPGYDWRLLECEVRRAEQPLAARALQPPLELIERTGECEWNRYYKTCASACECY